MLESTLSLYRMLPEIENLLHLQEADKAIRRLQDEIAELPKRVASIEQKLAATKLKLEKAQAAVKADEASRRKYETTITDLQSVVARDPVRGKGNRRHRG
jgi:predicted  nucleic acid-binding Zn-ribbon protein